LAGAHLKKDVAPPPNASGCRLAARPKDDFLLFHEKQSLEPEDPRVLNQVCQSLQTDLIWNFTIVVLPFLSQFLFSQKRPFIRRRLVVGRMKGAWYIFAPFHVQKLPVSSMCQIFLFCKCYEMEWLFR
jgi:hypothetical protein